MKNKENFNIVSPNVNATSKTEKFKTNEKVGAVSGLIEEIAHDVDRETLELVQAIETSSLPSKEKKELRNRIANSLKKMLRIFYFATGLIGVADVVETVATHQYSRYKVESKIVVHGQVEYAHEDKETTHILNLLSGKEKLNDSDRRNILVDYLSTRVGIPPFEDGSIKQEELNAMPFDKLYEIAWSFVVNDNGNDQYFSKKQTIDRMFDVGLDKFDPELYNALWQLLMECGNPKVRFSLDQKTNTDGRSFYDSKTNTIYICSRKNNNEYIDHYITELAHANQFSKNPIYSTFLDLRDLFNIQREVVFGGGIDIDVYEDSEVRAEMSQKKLYEQPGTLEHDAHSVIEPKLVERFKYLTSKSSEKNLKK